MRVPVWRGCCSRLPEVGRKPHAAYTGADKEEEEEEEEEEESRGEEKKWDCSGAKGGRGGLQ